MESVLEDMYEKVEELQQVLKEHVSTKNALKVMPTPVICVGHRVGLHLVLFLQQLFLHHAFGTEISSFCRFDLFAIAASHAFAHHVRTMQLHRG